MTAGEGDRAMRMALTGRMHDAGVTFVTGADSGINPFIGSRTCSAARRNSSSMRAPHRAQALAAVDLHRPPGRVTWRDRKGLLRKGYDADV